MIGTGVIQEGPEKKEVFDGLSRIMKKTGIITDKDRGAICGYQADLPLPFMFSYVLRHLKMIIKLQVSFSRQV